MEKYTMANLYSQFTYDDALELKSAGLLAASADGTILDLGAGLFDGFVVVDMTACEVATGDEIYTVSLEGSNVATMTSGSVCLGKKVFGNLVVPMDAALSTAGRYVIPVRNEEGGSIYRYVRLSTLIAGTIATGINFSAFLAKR
jgi:hypothetical protein